MYLSHTSLKIVAEVADVLQIPVSM